METTTEHVLWVVLPGVVGIVAGVLAFGTADYSVVVKVLAGVVITTAAAAATMKVLSRRTAHTGAGASKGAAVTLGGVAGVGFILLAVFTVTGWPAWLAVPQTSQGQFVSPQDGDAVVSPVTVRGTAKLPDNESLWILIQPPDGRFYATKASAVLVQPDDSWAVQGIGVGRGEGGKTRSYTLYLVTFPDTSTAMTDTPADGGSISFDGFPADAEQLDILTIRTEPL